MMCVYQLSLTIYLCVCMCMRMCLRTESTVVVMVLLAVLREGENNKMSHHVCVLPASKNTLYKTIYIYTHW
jgi:hypothetical protein